MSEQFPPEAAEERKFLYEKKKQMKVANPATDPKIKGNRIYVGTKVKFDLDKQKATCKPNDDNHTQITLTYMQTMKHSGYIEKKGSTFQSHFVPITSAKHINAALTAIRTEAGVATATHTIYAVCLDDGTSVYADDGEHRAGGKLLDQLKNSGKHGLLACSRWYGGIHLGGTRFAKIAEAADIILKSI